MADEKDRDGDGIVVVITETGVELHTSDCPRYGVTSSGSKNMSSSTACPMQVTQKTFTNNWEIAFKKPAGNGGH
jgi:hypothetical protein